VPESGFFILQTGDIHMLNRMQIEGVVLKTWTYAGTPFARMVNRPDPGIDGGDILFIARLPATVHQVTIVRPDTSLAKSTVYREQRAPLTVQLEPQGHRHFTPSK
jgi:hypothetical protein